MHTGLRSNSLLAVVLGCSPLLFVATGCGGDDSSSITPVAGSAGDAGASSGGKQNTAGAAHGGSSTTSGGSSESGNTNGGSSAGSSESGNTNGGSSAASGESGNTSAGSGGNSGATSGGSSGATNGGGGQAGSTGGQAGSTGGQAGSTGGQAGSTGGQAGAPAAGAQNVAGAQSGGGSTSTGGATGGAGAGGASAGAAGAGASGAAGSLLFDFEGDVNGWTADNSVPLAVSSDRAVTGTQSLKISMPALPQGTNQLISVGSPQLWPGQVVTVHLYLPANAGSGIYFQAFSQDPYDTSGNAQHGLTAGAWNTFTYTVPQTLPRGISKFGIQVGCYGPDYPGGDFYLDSITVAGPQVCAGTGTGFFTWETAGDAQGWYKDGDALTVSQSTEQAKTGTGSLKLAFNAMSTTDTPSVQLDSPNAYCGQTLSYDIWTPADSPGLNVVLFVLANNYVWTATTPPITNRGGWTTVTRTFPDIGPQGLQRIGIQFQNPTGAAYTGNLYLDNVTWQ